MNADLERAAARLLSLEALHLDQQDWDAWLALYEENAVFWVPGWRSEHMLVTDPETEVSLIYCEGRKQLEDRVWRARSGRSAAATPLPRTSHIVGNVLVDDAGRAGQVRVRSGWSCHVFSPKTRRQHVFFGRYDYLLRADASAIVSKTIVLANDYIPASIDFYCL